MLPDPITQETIPRKLAEQGHLLDWILWWKLGIVRNVGTPSPIYSAVIDSLIDSEWLGHLFYPTTVGSIFKISVGL